jgi:hypothetical protein
MAAFGVRLELQDILRNLSERIRLESSGSLVELRKRARLAEVSAVRAFTEACTHFLVTHEKEQVPQQKYLVPGQIQDLLDASLLDARELKVSREEAERKLEELSDMAEQSSLVVQLAELESQAFAEVHKQETYASDVATQGLQTCISNMSELLIDALCAARESSDDEQRRRIGTEALVHIQAVAGRWATWFAASERNATAVPTPAVPLLEELAAAMTANAQLHELVLVLRHAMKLRRRQVRMCSALQRMRSAASACSALSALSGSVSVL